MYGIINISKESEKKMLKKIAGISVCVLLASSIALATEDPFSEEADIVVTKTDISTSTSEEIETAKVTTTESNKKETEEESKEESTSQYTVVAGDYLSGIAAKLLGDASRWPEIVALNKDKYPSLATNPNLIYVGWVLTIPGAKGNTSSNNTSVSTSTSTKTSTKTSTSTSTDTSTDGSSKVRHTGDGLIAEGSRVLHIGDSHSMGIYGKTIDGLMRETGATVRTEAFGGANPQWFMNGQRAVCGSYSKDENGHEVSTGNNQINTPLLSDMLGSYKPSVLVVSLGANMVAFPEATQRSMVTNLLDQAKAAGCQIVWVGPPDSRAQKDSDIARLHSVLESELPKYDGVLVDSRKYTKYPASGGDGIHYWGDEGVATARKWANETLNDINGK